MDNFESKQPAAVFKVTHLIGQKIVIEHDIYTSFFKKISNMKSSVVDASTYLFWTWAHKKESTKDEGLW